MILFPYAKDVEYENNTLTLTLDFFEHEAHTEVALSIKIDNDVATVIESLLEKESSNDI